MNKVIIKTKKENIRNYQTEITELKNIIIGLKNSKRKRLATE